MKLCPSCGKKCADASKICIYCGEEFKVEVQQENSSEIKYANDESCSKCASTETEGPDVMPDSDICKTSEEEAQTKAKRVSARTQSRAYSFADSLPDGFSMTREEADSLLFGKYGLSDDFGNAVPVPEDDEIISKNASSVIIPIAAMFSLVFVIASFLALFNFVSMKVTGAQITFASGLLNAPLILPVNVLFIILGIAVLPLIVNIIGACVLYFSSNSEGTAKTIIGSLNAVKIGIVLMCIVFVLALVAVDGFVFATSAFPKMDNILGAGFVVYNFLMILNIVSLGLAYSMCKNCTDVLAFAEKLKPSSCIIDIVSVINILVLVFCGFMFVANGGMNLIAANMSFTVPLVIAYFAMMLSILLFNIVVIALRHDVNSSAHVVYSVEKLGSGSIKYK